MSTAEQRRKNRERNARYRANLSPEKKHAKYLRDRKLVERKKRERLAQNSQMMVEGKRICSYCCCKKQLSEFSRSKGCLTEKWNSICDSCLCRIYTKRGQYEKGFSEVFWRRKAYSANSTEKIRRRRLKDLISIQDLPGKLAGADLVQMLSAQKGVCAYCGVLLTPENLGLDHRQPLSRGGTHGVQNVHLVCKDCNQLKATRTDSEFLEFLSEYVQRFSSRTEG